MSFEEAVEELESRVNDRKEPSLEQTRNSLDSIGCPEEDYEVILIGGTNGKGSTAEMVSEMLQSLGFSVGKYTSPHLVSLRERIEVDGEKIGREEFMELYSQLEDFELTFFEFMTVAAYYHFSREDVDYAVMEVGMGGRLDATNAAENSTAVITNVGLDHQRYLGETREEIAREKAGIIPGNGKLIDGSDLAVFSEKAREMQTEVLQPAEVKENRKLVYRGQEFEIPVEGGFQVENLETALATVSAVEEVPGNLAGALEDISCPGRMEKVDEEPETVLDGAHNAGAVKKTVQNYEEGFVCVFAALGTKNVDKMIGTIEEKASKIYVTQPEFRMAEKPEKIMQETSVPSETVEEPVEALERAREEGRQVVVTGSMYLVGDLKKNLRERS